jgi:hypothetical protein
MSTQYLSEKAVNDSLFFILRVADLYCFLFVPMLENRLMDEDCC